MALLGALLFGVIFADASGRVGWLLFLFTWMGVGGAVGGGEVSLFGFSFGGRRGFFMVFFHGK
jgi:hypothetical protein